MSFICDGQFSHAQQSMENNEDVKERATGTCNTGARKPAQWQSRDESKEMR
jgi:hypothetical protein